MKHLLSLSKSIYKQSLLSIKLPYFLESKFHNSKSVVNLHSPIKMGLLFGAISVMASGCQSDRDQMFLNPTQKMGIESVRGTSFNSVSDSMVDRQVSEIGKARVHAKKSSLDVEHDREFAPNVVKPVQVNDYASASASRIVESLALNNARLAASSKDKCPKLISESSISGHISRKHEVLNYDYCDYYLYPAEGQTLMVSSKPYNTKSTLVSPTTHSFDEGAYKVSGFDKHVVRVNYKGSKNPSDSVAYDLDIAIN